jgi:hypothetical protein
MTYKNSVHTSLGTTQLNIVKEGNKVKIPGAY